MKNKIRLIPEFETHYGTIVMFPFRTDIWRDDARYMQEYVVKLACIISKYEPVILVCRESDISSLAYLEKNKRIQVISLPYDDIWARDIGPTFIEVNGKTECISWKFNAWGGKKEGSYYPWDQDDAFAERMADFLSIPCRRIPLVLEGGAILTDGCGTLFTTRSVLLNRNRNPFKSLDYVEGLLKESLQLEKIVWIKQGLAQDETNGHIDNLMAVVKPHEICLAWTDDPNNPNYLRVRRAYKTLSAEYDCTIHKVPLPEQQLMTPTESLGLVSNTNAISRNAGDLLPASYLNYYVVNNGVIVPSFGCKEDDQALDILSHVYSDRQVIQLFSHEPLLGGGGIHCILHEIPQLR